MTILEALNWAQRELKRTAHEKTSGPSNPMLDAQVLLGFVLDKPNAYLFAHFEDRLPEIAQDQFIRLVERRVRHEPIAYLTGRKEFYGRPFYVNSATLIPRPETELLIDLAKSLGRQETTFIDVGTGSGAIAVSVAAETGQSVVATDVSIGALNVARHNAQHHRVEHHISFLAGNLLAPYLEKQVRSSEGEHVMILANLPYLPNAYWKSLDPDVNAYEPKQALMAGVDGLDAYDALLQQLSARRETLPRHTDLACEIDPSQATSLPALIATYFPQAQTETMTDLAGRPRVIRATI